MGAVNTFKKTFDRFSQTRKPLWQDFAIDAPPVFRPGEFLGYVGGRTAADYMNDATRNYVWRWNALQAQTTDLGRYIGQQAGLNKRDSRLAGLALTNVVELASGNIDLTNLGEAGRPQGYRTIFPEESKGIDPRTGETVIEKNFLKSQNPIAEMGARYFLGRTGRLLPWDQFTQERPDVTPEQYNRVIRKQRERTLFGLENASRVKTGGAGLLAGAAISALTKKGMPVIAGTAAGVMAPGAANIASELGVVQGTRESFDDPVGELRVFGYRLPIARVAGAVALAAGVGVGGKKLIDSGLLKKSSTLKKAYKAKKVGGKLWSEADDAARPASKLWDDAQDLEKVVPATEAELREVARRLGRNYPGDSAP